jgi:hypothetical protein
VTGNGNDYSLLYVMYNIYYRGVSTLLMLVLAHALTHVSELCDGFISPCASNAIHWSPAFKWLSSGTVIQRDGRQGMLQFRHFKALNEQSAHSQQVSLQMS